MTPLLLLASGSPRRRELLEALGVSVEVRLSSVDESLRPGCRAEEEAVRLAVAKARQCMASDAAFVVAADTLVALDSTILGKPDSPQEAAAMLRKLRGCQHRVVTGLAVAHAGSGLSADGQVWADLRVSQVWMRPYTDREIADFVATRSPLDKAGAYAIQDTVFQPVERIEGCYCNIVGLPLGLLVKLLQEAGYPPIAVGKLPQCAACPDWPTSSSAQP